MTFSRFLTVASVCLTHAAEVGAGHPFIVSKNELDIETSKIRCVFARQVMGLVLMKKIEM